MKKNKVYKPIVNRTISTSISGFRINHNNSSFNSIQLRQTECKEFKELPIEEKYNLVNMVRLYDSMLMKGYVEKDDYAGELVIKSETNRIILGMIFGDFSEKYKLQLNESNIQDLFHFMGKRYGERPAVISRQISTISVTHSGVTYRIDEDVINTIMSQYRCSYDTIIQAMSQIAHKQGGNGIKILSSNHKDYTAELKIQVMGDYRLFTKDVGNNKTFSIIDRGFH